MKSGLLRIREVEPGIQEITMNLTDVYSCESDKKKFEERFADFMSSDCFHSKIFKWQDNMIVYRTECIVPNKWDSRPPLLLVFGNPASHSVASGMFFSYEGDKKEHGIWNVLNRSGILSFPLPRGSESRRNLDELMQLRKNSLLDRLDYESEFQIGFVVYYSMPTPATGKWSGVSGLHKLFASKAALDKIGEAEKQRIEKIISNFMTPNGAVITFQKDAYSGVKSPGSPDYKLILAKEGRLVGNCQYNANIRLFGMPPTRPHYRNLSIRLLQDIKAQVLQLH